jgi:hypothetical protein
MNKLSIIILLVAITKKYATANPAIPTTTTVLDASLSELSEGNETMMYRELSHKSAKFDELSPATPFLIDVPYVAISAVVSSPRGIKRVYVQIKYGSENYKSYRAYYQDHKYRVNFISLETGTYTWRIKAVDNRDKKKKSSENEIYVVLPKCIIDPGTGPSQEPSRQPSSTPSQEPSTQPSTSTNPSSAPSQEPSTQPSTSSAPSGKPTVNT